MRVSDCNGAFEYGCLSPLEMFHVTGYICNGALFQASFVIRALVASQQKNKSWSHRISSRSKLYALLCLLSSTEVQSFL